MPDKILVIDELLQSLRDCVNRGRTPHAIGKYHMKNLLLNAGKVPNRHLSED